MNGDSRYLRRCGVIRGDGAGLLPCIWIGLVDDGFQQIPWWPGSHVGSLREHLLKPGQLVLPHRYMGKLGRLVRLAGVLLPLSTCRDPTALQSLANLTTSYRGDPFRDIEPNLDELTRIRDELRSIGPLDATHVFRSTGEGLLSFKCSRGAYRWLAGRFDMISAIVDDEGGGRATIEQTSPMHLTVEEFASWLGNSTGRWDPWQLVGALVYQSSE